MMTSGMHRRPFEGRHLVFNIFVFRGVLRIPQHISVLHVEQEVTADDTTALESVLECDEVRHSLLQEEKKIQKEIAEGSVNSFGASTQGYLFHNNVQCT